MADFPPFPGFANPARARLTAMLNQPDLSAFRRAEVYCLLRRLNNRELACRLSRPACAAAPSAFDGGAQAAALWAAAREVCPFRSDGLVLDACSRPLPLELPVRDFSVILLGLICNCFLYGAIAPDVPRICLKTSRRGSQAVFELCDRGPGLPRPPEAPPAGGLNLARLLAQRGKGRFLLDSTPGQGTCAVLSLPLCPSAALPVPPTAAELLSDRLSPVFVQLAPRCILPD